MKVRGIAGIFVLSAVATVAMAGTASMGTTMLRMQPGEGVFTILDTRGVSPLPGSQLSIRDMEQGEPVVGAVADEAGRAVVELTEGRFIVNVNNINLSVLDVNPDAEHSECRIVMPNQDMLVGGQADEDTVALGSTMMTPVVIGGAVVLVGGVAYAIDEYSSSSSESEPRVVTPALTPEQEAQAAAAAARRRTVTEDVLVPVPVPAPPAPYQYHHMY